MNRGVDHQTVFFADCDRVEFERRLSHIRRELRVVTLAYCLMDNHFHLLLKGPPDALSPAMQHVGSVYTRHTNDRLGRDGPLTRGRFRSIPVETDAYLLQASRYIHRNALDLPGVRSPADHPWSSFPAYVGLRPPPDFLDLQPISDMLGGPAGVAAFTEDGTVPRRTSITGPDVRQVVECALAVDDLTHDAEGAGQGLVRTILVLVAERSPDPSIRAAARFELGDRSPRAEAAATARAAARHDADPVLRRVLAWVEAQLCTQGV